MIREGEFNRAREVVRRSGLAVELEERLRAGQGGAPRQLDVEVLLAACILVFGKGQRNATLVQVHVVLTKRLVVSLQERVGVRQKTGGRWQVLTLRQVRYLFQRICRLLDYSPHSTSLSAAERATREDETFRWLNELIRASIPADVPHADTLGVDATSIRTAARPCGSLPSAKGDDDYRDDTSPSLGRRAAPGTQMPGTGTRPRRTRTRTRASSVSSDWPASASTRPTASSQR